MPWTTTCRRLRVVAGYKCATASRCKGDFQFPQRLPFQRRFLNSKTIPFVADTSLAAVAGVTAADHERISKSYLDHLRVWVSRSHTINQVRLTTQPAGLYSFQSLGQIHFLCLLMGVISERAQTLSPCVPLSVPLIRGLSLIHI